MEKTPAFEKLRRIGQEHLFEFFDRLNPSQQQELCKQIESIDVATLHNQQQLLLSKPQKFNPIEPFQNFATIGNKEDFKKGKELIAAGKVGCLVVAGGQGTRLRFDGPKGKFPVSLIKKKSLFQLVAEKVAAAGKQAGKKLYLSVMTSPLNHRETIDFFEYHDFFGLERGQLSFFSQGVLPLLNPEGNLFLEEPYRIAMGPDGNGCSLTHFWGEGIWNDWYEKGVRHLNYILIDNPLADPFDAELIGYHYRQNSEVTVKCTPRIDPLEKEGVLVKFEEKVRVIEYSEFPEEEKHAMNTDGYLRHLCANLSLFVFHMDFIKNVADKTIPLHKAHKAAKMVLPNGEIFHPRQPNAWKFEKFIFDLLLLTEKISALLYPREWCFAPLKNNTGANSLEFVQAALLARDKSIFSEITGLPAPETPFELAQEFYYPTLDLLRDWKGKKLPNTHYIEPY